jgi:hypothetical protein
LVSVSSGLILLRLTFLLTASISEKLGGNEDCTTYCGWWFQRFFKGFLAQSLLDGQTEFIRGYIW